MSKTIISLKNVNKTFKDVGVTTIALSDISLEIYEGEFMVILGPSGSGKSTLLRIISGLEKNYEGGVVFGAGLDRRSVSFVFQQFAIFPWLNVYQNVELGLITREINAKTRLEKVRQELKNLGLEKFANSYPRELSGGMKQRVGIARALVTEPKIIFMDEPFSELDSFTADELRQELLSIWQTKKPTIVMVSHSIPEALELADRVVVLTPLPGKIEEEIRISLPRPRNQRVQEFYELEDKIYKIIKP